MDSFARESGPSTLSVFRLDPNATPFNWSQNTFKVPHVDDMVVYELYVDEFNETSEGVARQLDYLLSLGINVIEFMPFTNVKEEDESESPSGNLLTPIPDESIRKFNWTVVDSVSYLWLSCVWCV